MSKTITSDIPKVVCSGCGHSWTESFGTVIEMVAKPRYFVDHQCPKCGKWMRCVSFCAEWSWMPTEDPSDSKDRSPNFPGPVRP